ncbi:hypothetical protein IAQ61_010260 [Plenodomus lingam]|uniref:uncharacterized protein n=1 Tax=Leptosphaeria maculans TaxID=5022 RepID=UPI003318E784|nr:hypothetical protein IAQ61_010260 [Plenodomus lingam]
MFTRCSTIAQGSTGDLRSGPTAVQLLVHGYMLGAEIPGATPRALLKPLRSKLTEYRYDDSTVSASFESAQTA